MKKVLLAVDDSPASLTAARLAVDLATGWQAQLRVVHCFVDGHIAEVLRAPGAATNDVSARQVLAASAVLEHVKRLATAGGVDAETVQVAGDPAREVLDEARRWSPDLLVIGLSSHDGIGTPYVGATTRHLLEFAEQPVLVVPGGSG